MTRKIFSIVILPLVTTMAMFLASASVEAARGGRGGGGGHAGYSGGVARGGVHGAGASRVGVYRGGVSRVGVYRGGVSRVGVYRGGVSRVGVYPGGISRVGGYRGRVSGEGVYRGAYGYDRRYAYGRGYGWGGFDWGGYYPYYGLGYGNYYDYYGPGYYAPVVSTYVVPEYDYPITTYVVPETTDITPDLPPLYSASGGPDVDATANTTSPDMTGTALPVHLTVTLPASAILKVNGIIMDSTGIERNFDSPPILPGHAYKYMISATWVEHGRTITRSKEIPVTAGEHVIVKFESEEMLPRL